MLADRFSTLIEQNNREFITFYEVNKSEIGNLKDFATDEELYLSAVINHTYGRSLLYENKDYRGAEKHLDIARSLILNYKDKFEIELTEDIWYLQTLQHLLKASVSGKKYKRAQALVKELKIIDIQNLSRYCLEEKEINRTKTHAAFRILAYGGITLLASSVTYSFVFETTPGYIASIGTITDLIGLAGQYYYRDKAD
jgi:hypothetical protein